jgi:hypothetical protein
VVDLDAALGKEFLDVAVGQAEARVPADRDDDHLEWEAEAGEGRSRTGSSGWAADLMPAVSPLRQDHSQRNSPPTITSYTTK